MSKQVHVQKRASRRGLVAHKGDQPQYSHPRGDHTRYSRQGGKPVHGQAQGQGQKQGTRRVESCATSLGPLSFEHERDDTQEEQAERYVEPEYGAPAQLFGHDAAQEGTHGQPDVNRCYSDAQDPAALLRPVHGDEDRNARGEDHRGARSLQGTKADHRDGRA